MRLGPVHTAGEPLIKSGCREIFSSPRHFCNEIGKLLPQLKNSQKKSQSSVLILLLPWVRACWIPRFPILQPASFRPPYLRRFGKVRLMSALAPKADIAERDRHVCFVPTAEIGMPSYSITSSANNKNDSGTERPSPLAVFKFTTKLNFVGS